MLTFNIEHGKRISREGMILLLPSLARILTPSRAYLIDTGNEGRERDSRPTPPHPPGDLFLTGGPDESR